MIRVRASAIGISMLLRMRNENGLCLIGNVPKVERDTKARPCGMKAMPGIVLRLWTSRTTWLERRNIAAGWRARSPVIWNNRSCSAPPENSSD